MLTRAIAVFGVTAALLLGAGGSEAADRGAVRHGKALAQKWCGQCHVEARGRRSPGRVEDVPSFAEIAAKDEISEDRLRFILSGAHRQMPTDKLSFQQIEALIAYILSLKKR